METDNAAAASAFVEITSSISHDSTVEPNSPNAATTSLAESNTLPAEPDLSALPGAPKLVPLHQRHQELGAKFADFGGWLMPVEYAGGGVLNEHRAVRERVGLFDVSHLGKVRVSGTGAAEFLNTCLTNDIAVLSPGQAQYTLCCNESGGVVDDLIAYFRSLDDVFLIPNAANTAEVVRLLRQAAPTGIEIHNEHLQWAVFAVQGPRSAPVLQSAGVPAGVKYLHFTETLWQQKEILVCGSGYTGEQGFEVLIDTTHAQQLWDALLAAVTAAEGLPAGLGARDTLRTEMGYPLHGHEITSDITPVEAGLSWAVAWRKPAFWGRVSLLTQRESGPHRRAWGLRAVGRGIPRGGAAVWQGDRQVGHTTSGTYSPTLATGIALALLDPQLRAGERVEIDIRGRRLPCEVVKPPLVPSHVRD